MRPVLLKSAGIVGLAGAIMAVVSANALFVDPGGPPRDSSPQIVGPSIVTPAPVVFAASPTVADAPEDTTAVPHVVTTVPIAVDEPGDVAATTPIIQPEPVEAEPEAIETLPPVEPAAPEPAVGLRGGRGFRRGCDGRNCERTFGASRSRAGRSARDQRHRSGGKP